MKKFYKCFLMLLLVAIVTALIPINGFCDQPYSQDVTHQCALPCHAHCCQSTLPNNTFSFNLPSQATFFLFPESRSHEDPFLSTSKRPPIVLS